MLSEEAFVRFTSITAEGLPDADGEIGEGSSDPYVVFIIHCGDQRFHARTATIIDADRYAYWEEACQITIPHNLPLERSSIEVQASCEA